MSEPSEKAKALIGAYGEGVFRGVGGARALAELKGYVAALESVAEAARVWHREKVSAYDPYSVPSNLISSALTALDGGGE